MSNERLPSNNTIESDESTINNNSVEGIAEANSTTPEVQEIDDIDERARAAAADRQPMYKNDHAKLVSQNAGELHFKLQEQYDIEQSTGKVSLLSKINSRYTLGVMSRIEKQAAKREKSALKMEQRKEESDEAYIKRKKRDKLKRDLGIVAGVGLVSAVMYGSKSMHMFDTFDSMAGNRSGGTTSDAVDLMNSPTDHDSTDNGHFNTFGTQQAEEALNHKEHENYLNTFLPDSFQNPAMWEGKDHPNDFGPALESRPGIDHNWPGETDSYWRMRDNGHQFALAASEMKISGAPVESDFATKDQYMDAVNKFGEDLNHDTEMYSDKYEEYMDKMYNAEHPATYEMINIDFPYESGYMDDGDANNIKWDNYVNHGGTAVKMTASDGSVIYRRLDCDNIIRPLPVETYVAPVGGSYTPEYTAAPVGNGEYVEQYTPVYEEEYTTPTGGGNPTPPITPETPPEVPETPPEVPETPPEVPETPPEVPYVKGDTPAPDGMPQMGAGPLTGLLDVVQDTVVDQGGRDNGTGGTAPIPESSSFTPGTQTGIDIADSTPAQDITKQPGGTKVDAPTSTGTVAPGAIESTL